MKRHVNTNISKNRTCNLCDFASVQAGELRGQGHVYYNIWENRTHATNVTNVVNFWGTPEKFGV